ncbi:3-hydroxybutyryl-CoA dehydrogenase [bioreactor metagenome]|jgi:3-hydroxybutyryl-CoA dehydrogenase|uniref:3-hydroxybutyryl-CoA dehydrogenase n=1 Tax=bioreactor metagenome TaxID=1076179 RepID=A0A644TU66_9ZZZZ|nr:3-hydroxyacyl-CoA dehydrogenase NAD-binding domain-containing protein [Spirochaetales bacterium]
MKTVFVIGSGTMGRGIAQVAAQAKYEVYLSDIQLDIVKRNMDIVEAGLQRQIEKGKITKGEVGDILGRIQMVQNLENLEKADYVIEAVLEDVALKREIFKEADRKAKPEAILASNTTSCSITEIASAVAAPERVIGMHFFNPPVVMQLVELMPGILSSRRTVEKAKEFVVSLGKEAVTTKKEGPAGVTSRILAGLLNEAIWVLQEGIASVEAIDRAMVLGCNHKMGPFALIDLIGVDIHFAKTQMLYKKTGDARYRPCYLLEQMMAAGLLGKKSGRGFYDYSKDPVVPTAFFDK